MKQKILGEIDDFVRLCYTAFKLSAGDFAKENFTDIVEKTWENEKSDEENLHNVKKMFELYKTLQKTKYAEAANVIEVFQKGWLDKI